MKERHDPSTKSYYRCLSCARFRKSCGGRPTRGMDTPTWCEYMRDVKDHFHLTNANIAKDADVSIKTIERIMSIKIEQDIMRTIAISVEQAVIGNFGDHTCYLDHCDDAERISRLLQEIEYWKKENDRKAKIIDKYLDS